MAVYPHIMKTNSVPDDVLHFIDCFNTLKIIKLDE